MSPITSSTSLAAWIDLAGRFDEAAEIKPGLASLERWWLSLSEASPSSPAFGRDDLIKLSEWKGTRGKFRPALVRYAKDQDDTALQEAFTEAIKLLRANTATYLDEATLKAALAPLLGLRGIGPATASAVLAAFDDRICFMSDELLERLQGKRDYTLKAYLALFAELQGRQRAVVDSGPKRGDEEKGNAWISLRDMERAVFVDATRRKNGHGRRTGGQQQQGGRRAKRSRS